MIKAIATDLDGTLFYPKRRIRLISSQNKQFIKNAVSNGLDVILVTGRNYSVSSKVEEAIGLKNTISIIGCNGAFIAHKGEIIQENYIDRDEAIKLYDLLSQDKDVKTIMIFSNKKHMLIDSSFLNPFEKLFGTIGLLFQGAYFEPFKLGRKKVLKELEDKDLKIYKIMPWYGYKKGSKEISFNACKKYNDLFKGQYECSYSEAALEIQAKGINKANALQQLIRKLNIEKDETVVVGDSGNDIAMFKEFNKSFVMSHAPETVKVEAQTVIDSVSDIQKFL
ncbi:MAG: HAD family hydrolase [Bacillales bacterium]|nr:HAD family hydrolase [Bacillales bacterium]